VAAASKILEITPTQAFNWLSSGEAMIIDVREPDEFAREHIQGASSMPLSRLDPAVAWDNAGEARRLVVQCQGGRRSMNAARILTAVEPSRSIYSIAGGIEGWKKERLPVTLDRRVSSMSVMRQVQLVIGVLLLAGGALAWWIHPAFIGISILLGGGLVFAGSTGTCGLALLIERLAWNRPQGPSPTCTTRSSS
jgi:rhodanese-related sulfurtransferase